MWRGRQFGDGDVRDLLLVERISNSRFFLFARVQNVVFFGLLQLALKLVVAKARVFDLCQT